MIDGGRVVQLGPAAELSARPASAFVADFTGAVVLTGVARAGPGRADARGARRRRRDRQHGRATRARSARASTRGRSCSSRGIRAARSAQNHLSCEVVSITEIGGRARVGLLAGQPLVAEVSVVAVRTLELAPGARVTATWKAAATRLAPR